MKNGKLPLMLMFIRSLDSVYDEYSIWFASRRPSSPEEALSNTRIKKHFKRCIIMLAKKRKEALVIQLYYVEELNVL